MRLPDAPEGQVSDAINSRSVRAGYDPRVVADARIVVAGLGALGQNIVQTLTLTGAGHLVLIDCDGFEEHNATRSPFYPTRGEQARYGSRKAYSVARHAFLSSTCEHPEVLYADSTLQRLGDGCIRSADVVVAAVDNVKARAWIAERARLHGKPVVEGGFSGPEFNFSTFAGTAGATCYRCQNPVAESSASCTQYALQAERQQIIPAIQATAAVLGGFMAEQVMNVLHDRTADVGRRFYGHTRQPRLASPELVAAPECPGEHYPLPARRLLPPQPDLRTLADLQITLRKCDLTGWIGFAEPIVLAAACTRCAAVCRVRAMESSWLLAPRCTDCGGTWPAVSTSGPGLVRMLDITSELDEETADVLLADLGICPGGCLLIEPEDEPRYLLEIPGDGAAGLRRITDSDVSDDQRVAIRLAAS
jgi:molybdopterin/thiamine biosynthesis adenylyltransferase